MRYLPHSEADRQHMRAVIGISRTEDLFGAVPDDLRLGHAVDLPGHKSELEVDRYMRALAGRNRTAGEGPFFVGAGAYRHHVPATVDHLIQRSEFLTAYTPYQPEISQGTLQTLFEFQTQVAHLTGMEVANASMYDGSTALAEAALMAQRLTRRQKLVVSGGVHPQYRDVLSTYVSPKEGLWLAQTDVSGAEDLAAGLDSETAAIIVQTPDFFGNLRDVKALADAAHAHGALLIVSVTEVISLGLIEAPGALGADIVVAEGQSLGNPLTFGGPYVGLLATRNAYVRQMPGRVCGQTVDARGERGFVLTLSTREQHIRREKATSNICTNSGLCALAFTIHLSLLGERGLTRLARLNHKLARDLAQRLMAIEGVELVNRSFFNEFTLRLPKSAANVVDDLARKGVLGGVPVSRLLPQIPEVEDLLVVAVTETSTESDFDDYVAALAEVLK
ncbi:MAG: aminomethyl-transferring glycine dehydrogenase subunit GcvPA [Hyphomicrobiaceae bacterium]|nr:aminomethyl-transferring glycine dehydrogenase subunit GcvPA [Hyphomicrobiaceae bacterium]